MTTDSTPTPAEPLKPCPFCGTVPDHAIEDGYGSLWICCDGCGVTTSEVGVTTRKEAIERWNRRATPAAAAEIAQLAAPEPLESNEWVTQARLTLDRLAAFLQRINAPHAIDWREWIANAEAMVLALQALATQAQPATHAEVLTQRQRAAGAALSNCAFNLAQRNPGQFTARDIEALNKCRREWDAASAAARTTVKPAPASIDESRVELAAKAIFEHWEFGASVAWVEHGNSDMQDRARRFARAALATQEPKRKGNRYE